MIIKTEIEIHLKFKIISKKKINSVKRNLVLSGKLRTLHVCIHFSWINLLENVNMRTKLSLVVLGTPRSLQMPVQSTPILFLFFFCLV